MISAVAIAAETAGLAQFLERAGDFAAVVAADSFDNVRIEHGRRRQRLLDVLIARAALKCLGGASRQRDLSVAAERFGAIETGFGAGAAAIERGIHRHS